MNEDKTLESITKEAQILPVVIHDFSQSIEAMYNLKYSIRNTITTLAIKCPNVC